MRVLMLVVLGVIVADGLLGPSEAATTLAGTWPWTHWRGIAAVSVVVAGNLACMSCPLIAPRTLLRRWIHPAFKWPSRLRSKWLVAAIVLAWLVAYEALAWWDSGLLTAWLLMGLVVGATVVDLLFEGSSFCQWLCPIGQWNMSMSIASPTQVQAIDPAVCERCVTQDCLRGGPLGPGCGTSLFLPRKGGALDCTACMDCVTACPHGNAGLRLAIPFSESRSESGRSVIGRWVDRGDIAALLLVLGAGGIANAMLMTQPVASWASATLSGMPPWSRAAVVTTLAVLAIAMVPVTLASIGCRIRGEAFGSRLSRLVADLWPLGVAIWVVHFGFHLVTGWRSAWPPLQRAARDAAALDLGTPEWAAHCCASVPDWIMPAMLLILAIALTISLERCWFRARGHGVRSNLWRWWPDALACMVWWALAVWVVLQPMEMRGLLG
jgi:ferredoxin